ncbi:MAG: hypothetical protein RMM08_07470 [Armatimonadota bacterium]|nr:hypothetical protein [bacterium]MDW8321185.1 hypothetical protein [Armatimonadota bacterium]
MSELKFSLHAPTHLSTEQILEIAQYAHRMAQVLSFQRVEPVIALEGEAVEQVLSREPDVEFDPDRILVHSLFDEVPEGGYDYEFRAVCSQTKFAVFEQRNNEDEPEIWHIPPQRIVGFYARSGRGCSLLRLTFVQYPAEVVYAADSSLMFGWWAKDHVYLAEAYRYGEEHFVQCHLRHILLFRAIKQRFPVLKVDISDPTGYWKSGSLQRMLRKARSLFGSSPRQSFLQRFTKSVGGSGDEEKPLIKASMEREVLRELLSRN